MDYSAPIEAILSLDRAKVDEAAIAHGRARAQGLMWVRTWSCSICVRATGIRWGVPSTAFARQGAEPTE